MRYFFRMIVLLSFLLPAALHAQSQKIGHVNTQKLLNSMPQVEQANKRLDTLNQKYQKQLEELQTEFKKKQDDLQSVTDPVLKDVKQRQLEDLYKQIMDFQQSAQDILSKKQQEYMEPIKKQLTDVINSVAKEGGYTYILDSSLGVLLYAADSEDVTNQVKKKLDTYMPEKTTTPNKPNTPKGKGGK